MKARLWGLTFLGAGLFLGGCLTPQGPSEPTLRFQAQTPTCAVVEEHFWAWGEVGKILFQGGVYLPTPCYEVEAQLEPLRCGCCARCPNTYQLRLVATRQNVVCIECLGTVSFAGEIQGLEPGVYILGAVLVVDGAERPLPVLQVEVR